MAPWSHNPTGMCDCLVGFQQPVGIRGGHLSQNVVQVHGTSSYCFRLTLCCICRIEVFDCTLKNATSARVPDEIKSRTTFHDICIGHIDHTVQNHQGRDRVYMKWSTITNLIKLTQSPAYLKIDVEGAEYAVLKNLIDENHLIPTQIGILTQLQTPTENSNPTPNSAVELHYFGSARSMTALEIAEFAYYLYATAGYHFITRIDNPW